MPLCEYPKWPLRTGSGDPTVASSYTCVDDATAAATRTTLRTSSLVHTSRHPATLTATITSLRPAEATVSFYDGATLLGDVPVTNGQASVQLPDNLRAGFHLLTARFVPTDASLTGSTSWPVAVWAIRSLGVADDR